MRFLAVEFLAGIFRLDFKIYIYIYSYLAQLIQSLLWLPVLSGKFSSIGYTSGSCQMTCFLKVLLKALSPWSLGDRICLSLDQHR